MLTHIIVCENKDGGLTSTHITSCEARSLNHAMDISIPKGESCCSSTPKHIWRVIISGTGEVYVIPYQQARKPWNTLETPLELPTQEEQDRIVAAAREYFIDTARKLT